MIVSIKLAIPEGSVYTEELSNFLGTQAALMQSGVVNYTVTGDVTVNTLVGNFTVPFSSTGRFSSSMKRVGI